MLSRNQVAIQFLLRACQLTMFLCLANQATAADIRPLIYDTGEYREVVIEGTIEAGDFEKFIKIIRDNEGQISMVYIFSAGGDFYEAMKIGRAMRALELGSHVPMLNSSGHPSCIDDLGGLVPTPSDPNNCIAASAAFFIHIGSVSRSGNFLVVHRPYFEKGKFGELSEADAKKAFDDLQDAARKYMNEMGVPKHIQEDVLGTASDNALVLDEKTVKTYFSGELPYRHEWIINKCSRLSDDEMGRYENYSQRLLRSIDAEHANMSKEEWADLDAIQKKQKEQTDCAVSIDRQRRIEAYEKYFGVKPNDFSNHDFSKWNEAKKYLGKSFDEILGEEKFVEKDDKDESKLMRSATANAPYVALYDSLSLKPRVPRVVSSASLISTPNPSAEFQQHLIKSLEDVWGKQVGGNGTTIWRWDNEGFWATLKLEPTSATGSYMSLKIDEK